MSSSNDVVDTSSGVSPRPLARLLLAFVALLTVALVLLFVPVEFAVPGAVVGIVALNFYVLWVLLRRTRRIEEKLDEAGHEP